MQVWKSRIRYLGALLWVFGFIVLFPLIVIPIASQIELSWTTISPFLIPSLISLAIAAVLNRALPVKPLSGKSAVVVVALGWLVISLMGSMPFIISIHLGFLNALFESTSGFTTTGITIIPDLTEIPSTLILWRSLTQWIGGLGILTLFSVLVFNAEASHRLFGAESHKVISERPAPGLFSTLKILWSIYSLFTGLLTVVLILEGITPFDAINHALTALSTGGFSPHNASIDYFRQAGFSNYKLIEFTLIVGMLLGGISFVIHYQVLRGKIRALWGGMEIKLFYRIVIFSTGLVLLNHVLHHGWDNLYDSFRISLFQVVAVITTTGFGTRDIGGPFFPVFSQQIFLVLMVVGGMVGSTSGGLKVFRVGVLWKTVKRQIQRFVRPSRAVNPLIVDGKILPDEEIKRISALSFGWITFLVLGGMSTGFFTDLGPFQSFSGMFSALGNIGPSYIPLGEWPTLHPVVKIVYIYGMLAGRLEILPILLLFNPQAWR